MTQQNSSQKQKTWIRFALFYLASVVLLIVILAAFWPSKDNNNVTPGEVAAMNAASEQGRILQLNQVLLVALTRLQAVDQQYIELFSDSILAQNKELYDAKFEQLTNEAGFAEKLFSVTLDSVENLKPGFSGKKGQENIDALLTFFSSALRRHHANNEFLSLTAIRYLEPGNDAVAIIRWQHELQKKEDKIRDLSTQLKWAMNSRPGPTTGRSKPNEQQEVDYLQKVNKALNDDNDRLLIELARYKKTGTEEAYAKEKADLVNKINDLTAELYLARVDCNLTRADAKQVVYSSKQRKDLLAEALSVLNSLAQSDNSSLHEKIREKTVQLKAIANTVRD